ncbi:hypothetical protein D3C81_1152440 [compost metagenome]
MTALPPSRCGLTLVWTRDLRMSVVDMKTARLKVALGKALETMEQLAARVANPLVRTDLLRRAAATREKINALEARAK